MKPPYATVTRVSEYTRSEWTVAVTTPMSQTAVKATDAKMSAPGPGVAPPQRNAERKITLTSTTSRIGKTSTFTTSDHDADTPPPNSFAGSTTSIHRQTNAESATSSASSAALGFTRRLRYWVPRTSPAIRKP